MGEFKNARDAIKAKKGDLGKINSGINKNLAGTAKDRIDDLLKLLDKTVTDEQKFDDATTAANKANTALIQACKDFKAALQTMNNGDKQRMTAAQEASKWISQVLDAYSKQKLKDDGGASALRQIGVQVMKVNNLSQSTRTAASYCP